MRHTTKERIALDTRLAEIRAQNREWTEDERLEIQRLLEAAVLAEPPPGQPHTARGIIEGFLVHNCKDYKQMGECEFSMVNFLRERWPL